MASGDTLIQWAPLANEPPTASFATLDTRNQHPVLDFDAGADEVAIFSGILPQHYGGGGITAFLHYAMSSAVADAVVLETAFERIGDSQQDIDADGFATGNTATPTVPGTSGHVDIVSIAHTDGAQIDSIAVGEKFRLRVKRLGTSGSDTATGDLELVGVELRET